MVSSPELLSLTLWPPLPAPKAPPAQLCALTTNWEASAGHPGQDAAAPRYLTVAVTSAVEMNLQKQDEKLSLSTRDQNNKIIS